MNSWIDLHALWRIVVLGVVAGAGLPALFAVGLKALTLTDGGIAPPPRVALAGVCFAVVLAAIGWSIWTIVDGA